MGSYCQPLTYVQCWRGPVGQPQIHASALNELPGDFPVFSLENFFIADFLDDIDKHLPQIGIVLGNQNLNAGVQFHFCSYGFSEFPPAIILLISPLNPATAFHVGIAADFHRSLCRTRKTRSPEHSQRTKNPVQQCTTNTTTQQNKTP